MLQALLGSHEAVNKTHKFSAFMDFVLQWKWTKLVDLEEQKEGECGLSLVQKGEWCIE